MLVLSVPAVWLLNASLAWLYSYLPIHSMQSKKYFVAGASDVRGNLWGLKLLGTSAQILGCNLQVISLATKTRCVIRASYVLWNHFQRFWSLRGKAQGRYDMVSAWGKKIAHIDLSIRKGIEEREGKTIVRGVIDSAFKKLSRVWHNQIWIWQRCWQHSFMLQ